MIQLASTASPTSPRVAANARIAQNDGANEGEDGEINRLLHHADQIDGLHALVVSLHGTDLLCGLFRSGCSAATCLRPTARPEASAYELAFFPDLTPDTSLERIVRDARRALVPGGRLVARVRHDPTGQVARGLARRLKLNGFNTIRIRTTAGCTSLRADLPSPASERLRAAVNPRPQRQSLNARRPS
jgi:hypothetical protein